MIISIRKKILDKITLVAVVSTLLPLFSNAVYTYYSTKSEYYNNLQKESEITAKQLSLSIVTPLWSMDDSAVINLMISRFLHEEIYCVHVINPNDSSIMYGVERDSAWNPVIRKTVMKNGYTIASAPVENDGVVQGIVKVYMTDNLVKKRMSILLRQIIVSTIILNLILMGALFLFMRNIVVRPIMSIMEGLHDISEGGGDLTRRLVISSEDELGTLAKYFNKFITSLQQMVKSISTQTMNVTQSSSQLSDFSNEIATESRTVAVRAEAANNTSSEMNAQVKVITDFINDANSSVQTVSSSIEEMSTTIREIAKNAEKSSKTAEKAVHHANIANDQIRSLKNAAEMIGKFTTIIKSISDKTNLLALNATIEAATAGSAGRGFAVVASEIKELSKQTADATNDIVSMVNNIQNATVNISEYTQTNSEIIDEVNSYVKNIAASIEEQLATSNEILKNSVRISNNIQGMVSNVMSTSQHTNQISDEMNVVTGAVTNLAEKNNQILSNVSNLLELSRSLNDLVKRFQVG